MCVLTGFLLKMLKEKYNPDAIWFVDDVFTISHKWLTEFHSEIIKQNAIIPFECITRAERLNDEILQLLKEIGCFRIWIGAESGSQKIIDLIGTPRHSKPSEPDTSFFLLLFRNFLASRFSPLPAQQQQQYQLQQQHHHQLR